jgi:hypothetical protein
VEGWKVVLRTGKITVKLSGKIIKRMGKGLLYGRMGRATKGST